MSNPGVYVPGGQSKNNNDDNNNNNNNSNSTSRNFGGQQQQQQQPYIPTATPYNPAYNPTYNPSSAPIGGGAPMAYPVTGGGGGTGYQQQQQPPIYGGQGQQPPPQMMMQQPQYGQTQQQQQQMMQSPQYGAPQGGGGGGGYYGGAQPTPSGMGGTTTTTTSSYQHGSGPTHGVISEGNPVHCHKIDYEIHGSEMQLVEIVLDPGEVVIAEAGAMMYMENDIDFQAKLGDGSNPKMGFFSSLWSAGGRLFTGESLFVTHFSNSNRNGQQRRVSFAAPYPGTIIPIDMSQLNGHKLYCQKDAFLCAAKGTGLSIHFHKKLGAGLFGGEGFILQKLKGDGMAFIHAGGCIIKKELHGDRIRVDTGCLVAFSHGIDFSVTMVPGLKSILFGGEGLFLATLQGTGTVWLQSLPFSRLADRIIRSAPTLGGSHTGESTLFGTQMGDVISGDGISGMDGGQFAMQALGQGIGAMFRQG